LVGVDPQLDVEVCAQDVSVSELSGDDRRRLLAESACSQ